MSALGWWARGAWHVARKELLSLFVTPLAYLVATLFLLNQGYNFALLLRVLNDPLAAPGPVMQFYFGGSFFLFWLPVIFICAALSMRLVAEERRLGTLEALLTAPLSPGQLVAGKFVGAYAFYAALWLPTAAFYVLLMGAGARPEAGPVLAGYLGVGLVGASFLAVGLLASAIARSQLAAAVMTFVVCTIAVMSGLLEGQVQSEAASRAIQATSLLTMMQELAQGIVDPRWLYLHLAVTASLLLAAVVAVSPRRRFEHGLQVGLAAFTLANSAVLASRHAERGDWTGGHVYSLSERAREVLAGLPAAVEVTVIVPSTIGGGRPNPLQAELREVLARMTTAAPERLRVRFVDPDRDHQEASAAIGDYALTGRELADGVVLIRSGQGAGLRKAHLLPTDLVSFSTGPDVQVTGPRVKEFRGEEALLGKFLAVTDARRVVVCATQGHGEPALDSLEPYSGYAHLRDLLTDAGLSVRIADLSGPEGLSGCDVLLVGGPQGPLPPEHVKEVERFLAGGGDVLLLVGAVILRGSSGLAPNGLEELTAQRGIRFGERVVVDPSPMAGATPFLAFTLQEGWGDHPATARLVGQPISLLQVRELTAESPATTLIQTSERGWAEADILAFTRGEAPRFDPAVDREGPVPIAAAAELGGSRMIVVGSADFALNALLREDVVYDRGRDFLLNAVGWLSERDALLGLRPRPREHVKLVLQEDQLAQMVWMCLVGLPGFGAVLGLWVLWRRRV
ncbi:Gldg family protein [Nannocystis sp. ILAH1]|uniref:Gldg family protein n=1 Tax=unclassified Nannocystis TaxID=2627009 RepID=UPI0022718781|nr:Gldg family protein [Nannocystis sp. ILAH1]MCY1068198.1 Gldg family protein [Nannocystis sp. RBIL2]